MASPYQESQVIAEILGGSIKTAAEITNYLGHSPEWLANLMVKHCPDQYTESLALKIARSYL